MESLNYVNDMSVQLFCLFLGALIGGILQYYYGFIDFILDLFNISSTKI